jgi:hypothetical protein
LDKYNRKTKENRETKMNAIKALSGLTPEKEITYQPGSVIIQFYLSKIKE